MNSENEETSLKQIIQGFTGDGVSVQQGTVISASPLKIQIANDSKLIITSANTYVPWHLTNYTTTCVISKGTKGSVSAPANDGSRLTDFDFSGSITINNALKKGDKLHILSFNHGKQYFVLDRVA